MAKKLDIDRLLKASPSRGAARRLVDWADDARDRIVCGDMIVGIMTIEEAAMIPIAYRTAAQHGDANAWLKLASWHARPDFGEPDLDSAEFAMRRAIDANADGAPLELAKIRWFFKRDSATEHERAEAYRAVAGIVDADAQNAEALYYLALLTTHGFGVAASSEAGFHLQQQAADLGNTDAMFELYLHYATGMGVAVNEEAAFELCQRAANAGHPRAMYNMGAFNASGRGVPKNIPEAVRWYERAADAGNPLAMAGLAVIYATGDGVECNREYAQQLLDQADYCGLDVQDIREQVGL